MCWSRAPLIVIPSVWKGAVDFAWDDGSDYSLHDDRSVVNEREKAGMRQRLRTSVGALAVILGMGCSSSDRGSPSPTASASHDARPNIVLVVVDTLRSDHLSFHGYPRITTPFLDTLAAQSADFTRAYAPSSWTAPSTASLHTGLYPRQHGVTQGLRATKKIQADEQQFELNRIAEEVATLAEVLKNEGYTTVGVTDNINICPELGFAQGFDHFVHYAYRGAEAIAEAALSHSTQLKQAKNYFLYLHFMDPHYAYKERQPWFNQYQQQLRMLCPPCAKQGLGQMVSAYDSEIRYVDSLLATLATHFEWSQNTLFIFTSDHGEEFFDHGRLKHGHTLYEELVRVPLLLHYPAGGISPRKIDTPVSLVDILPTLAELTGASLKSDIAGTSIWPLAQGSNKAVSKRAIFGHLEQRQEVWQDIDNDVLYKMVVRDSWKLITQNVEGATERQFVFDLATDPGEQNNLTSQDAEAMHTLLETLLAYEKGQSARGTKARSNIRLDSAKIQHLKSLGYL